MVNEVEAAKNTAIRDASSFDVFISSFLRRLKKHMSSKR
jgi:hypothetical protein